MANRAGAVLRSSLGDVPWGNLFRWVVSTFLFTIVFFVGFGVPLTVLLASGDTISTHPVIEAAAVLLGAVVAALVVWSEDIPWPGDP